MPLQASRPLTCTPPTTSTSSNAGKRPTISMGVFMASIAPGAGERHSPGVAAPSLKTREVLVRNESDHDAGHGAGGHLDERAADMEQADPGQEPEDEPVQVVHGEAFGSSQIQTGHQHADHQESKHHSKGAEIDIELHHVSDSNARPGSYSEARVFSHQASASGGNRLVRPQRTRHHRRQRFP